MLALIVELASSRFTGNESAGSIDVVITKSNVLSNAIINAKITLTPISATGGYNSYQQCTVYIATKVVLLYFIKPFAVFTIFCIQQLFYAYCH